MLSKQSLPRVVFFSSVVAILAAALVARSARDDVDPTDRAAVLLVYNQGNYKEAYLALEQRLLAADSVGGEYVPDDFTLAVNCLAKLARLSELDQLREAMADVHSNSWRVLDRVAQSYFSGYNGGQIIGGRFVRGANRGGSYANVRDQDRVRALRLFERVRALVAGEPQSPAISAFYQRYAQAMQWNRAGWEMQLLTNYRELPEPVIGWSYQSQRYAPTDAAGKPVLYALPASFADAENDGERWRWLLREGTRVWPADESYELLARAQWSLSQFGVQTMAMYRYGWPSASDADHTDDDDKESGPFAVHTLGDNETIARLAVGIRRFELSAEYHPLALYRRIADLEDANRQQALDAIAGIYENRRQYPKAAAAWREAIAETTQAQYRLQRLQAIVGNWGRFETMPTQAAGTSARLDFSFRNATKVTFTARPIDTEKLLEDLFDAIEDRQPLDWWASNIDNLGYRFVKEDPSRYLLEGGKTWEQALTPAKQHFTKTVTLTAPLESAGAYFIEASVADGNRCACILWLADTTLVRKPLDDRVLYFVADARTGKPIEHATVDFFGYLRQRRKDGSYEVVTNRFAEFSDADGIVTIDASRADPRLNWMAMARTPDGRRAYIGFHGMWMRAYSNPTLNEVKSFGITDRPVYRPDQTVQYKIWIRRAKYESDALGEFGARSFVVQIVNHAGEVVDKQTIVADEYGGLVATWKIPSDAKLGRYRLEVTSIGQACWFRIEEYKKPEYEVTIDAPDKPIELGQKFKATIRAKYYFGAPVTEATVKYKVQRSATEHRFYPPGRWDWLYGRGYGWFGCDYDWYPGFKYWGCFGPRPWWDYYSPDPPEVVAESETEIGRDGSVEIEIDSSVAQALHGDTDHRYQITAEVVDRSRRSVVATHSVSAGREPFKVFGWLNRGHGRVGERIDAKFVGRTLDGSVIDGNGKATLYRIHYGENDLTRAVPQETEVASWTIAPKGAGSAEHGTASVEFEVAEAGQYRIAYRLTAKLDGDREVTREGGVVFVVRGSGFDGATARFDALELVPDRRQYAPGDTIDLLVNTDQADSTVLLFVRPVNGIAKAPQVLRLAGRSSLEKITVTSADMPNFFVEALTIANGKVHTVVREIIVPPASRVLDVAVDAVSTRIAPGGDAEIDLALTGPNGEPFVGDTVVSIYDKAVEYISGGSNVGDIRAHFWKWRRRHNVNMSQSMGRYATNLVPQGQTGMGEVGAFGGLGAPEEARSAAKSKGRSRRGLPSSQTGALGASRDSWGADKSGFILADGDDGESGDVAEVVEPTVRSNFADTAQWVASVRTDATGHAKVSWKMPENLTTWKAKVWSLGRGTRVGQNEVELITTKNLIVRLQAPRFFTERDEVVLSANVHNYLATAKSVEVRLEFDGSTLAAVDAASKRVDIAAGGEARVDWRVRVEREGEAVVRMLALTDEESDAVEQRFPVHVHGIDKLIARSGVIRDDQQVDRVTFEVPAARRVDSGRLEFRFSPTLAAAMLDALPYLAEYPYACTEQTLNRFLPAVLTKRVLERMGIDLAAVAEHRNNLNAQEIGSGNERAQGWKRYGRDPVFDDHLLDDMVRKGLDRLTQMQVGDGGWGWFSGYREYSSAHTTAYVVHGLIAAREAGIAVVPSVLERGVAWLERYQGDRLGRLDLGTRGLRGGVQHADNLDAFVHLVLTEYGRSNSKMREYLYRDRLKLAAYGLAMLGVALDRERRIEQRDMVIRNLSQYEEQDDENQTMHLRLDGRYRYYWYGSEFEAQAYYLKLLARSAPKARKTSRLVKYLLNNRKHATYWRSTRDTALCVEAMAEYLTASGEDRPEMTVVVKLDGHVMREVRIHPGNLFTFDNTIVVAGKELEGGQHVLEIERRGSGPLYHNTYVSYFSLEDHIEHAGLELKVARKIYRLDPVDAEQAVAGAHGQALSQHIEKFERVELHENDVLESGQLVEVELEIESKNDYEYLLFEDLKAAGFEAVDRRSGYNGNNLGAYVEYRDRKVCFFVRRLGQGRSSVSYRLRAEIPGRFSALPTIGYAMYAPELRGNADEIVLRITDPK